MKKDIVVILRVLMLSIFASCQKAEAIKESAIVDEKTELEPELRVQIGVITDTRVRLRSEPNLQSETLGHLDTGDRLIILDKSAEQEQIDTMTDYWYKVQAEGYPDGWVYGAFVDYEIVWDTPTSEEYARNLLGKADGIIMKSDLTGIAEFEYRTILNKELAISNEKNPIDMDLLKKAFSYVETVDVMTGKHPEDFVSPEYLNSIESVKKLTIMQNGEKVDTLRYKNGLAQYYSEGSWPNGALKYDDKGRLIKVGSVLLTYPQELQTDQVVERLYYGYDRHKRYRLTEDGFETYYGGSYTRSTASYGTSIKYIYKDGLLMEIKEKEIQNQRTIELGYVKELMETITSVQDN